MEGEPKWKTRESLLPKPEACKIVVTANVANGILL
jgi:hypothetical protein